MKKLDDGVALSFVRAAGNVAVQRTQHAGFFAAHDLMHYAVETTLGFRRGFMGLMAEGWSFDAFTDHDDPRYKSMPLEAVLVERLVDVLSRASRDQAWRDDDLRPLWFEEVEREIGPIFAEASRERPSREQMLRVCREYAALLERWARTPVGEHLELEWLE